MKIRLKKVVPLFGACLLLCLTLFVFGALNTYGINVNEFPVSLDDILLQLFLLTLIGTVVLFSVILPFNNQLTEKVVSIILMVSLLLWVQSSLIAWDYGRFDGKEINWSSFYQYGLVDSAVWILILGLGFIFSRRLSTHVNTIVLFLILIQLPPLVIMLSNINEEASFKRYKVDESNKFVFSSEKNVIILLLDTFQSDVFQEVINNKPELVREFTGVTYFRNALGGYPFTYASVPLILTGERYDNSVPVQDFIKKSFMGNSIPKILKNEGYQVHLHPYSQNTIYYDDEVASNFTSRAGLAAANREVVRIMDVTLFKQVPHFLKQIFYTRINTGLRSIDVVSSDSSSKNSHYPIQDSLRFKLQFEDEFEVVGSDAYFKYFHLSGLHRPLLLNENLEMEEMLFERENILRSGEGMLKLVNSFFKRLKQAGIYDKSLIVILADHGFDESSMDINYQLLTDMEASTANKSISVNVKSSAVPLILVKPIGAEGELTISDSPVSLGDTPQTIFSLLDLNVEGNGRSMFEQENGSRERTYYYYPPVLNWKDLEYLPPLKEYVVSGHSWLTQNWKATGRVLDPKSEWITRKPEAAVVFANELIRFGKEGTGQAYKQGTGWSYAEENFSWTSEKNARLELPVNDADHNLEMSLSVIPYLAGGKIESQRLLVSVFDKLVAEFVINKAGLYKVTIPRILIIDKKLNINFHLPDARYPLAMNTSVDSRELGIALISLQLQNKEDEVDATPLLVADSEMIFFGKGGSSSLYKKEGWSQAESSFTWTNKSRASLEVPFSSQNQDVEITVKLEPFIVKDVLIQQKIFVYVEDEIIGEWFAKTRGVYSMIVPREAIKSDLLKLSFGLPDAQSPADLGLSSDKRQLGISVESIRLNFNP